MNANSKKAMKLVFLLLTSILIGYVTAAAYTDLFMYATPITIGQAGVKFVTGDDTATLGGGDAITSGGLVVTFDLITIEAGQNLTYNEAVNITNQGTTTKTLDMTLDSITGNFGTNFESIYVTIIDENGTSLGNSIAILTSGSNVTDTGSISIAASETYTVRWMVIAQSTATTGESTSVTLKVRAE